MDLTPSLWSQMLRRASSLRRRYGEGEGSPQDTLSLVGRAAAKLRGARREGRDDEHFLALWTTTLTSVLNDLYRRRRTAEKLGVRVPVDGLGTPAGDRDAEFDAETIAALDAALEELARLDPTKAEITALRFQGGLSWPQAAAELGMAESTVRRHWSIARTKLLVELRRRGVEDPAGGAR